MSIDKIRNGQYIFVMKTKDLILAIRRENENATVSEIADKLKISRQAVHQTLTRMGLPTTFPRPLYKGPTPEKIPPLFGHRLSPHFAAAVAEMLVAVDLMHRGFDVYKSLASCGACDLVCIKRGGNVAIRVEVKTARRQMNGKLHHSPHTHNRFDVLALVCGDKSVTYLPDLVDE